MLSIMPEIAVVEAGPALEAALAASAHRHARLCPRQVLGVLAGLAAIALLGIPAGSRDLFAIVETDGCFVDGVEAATGCSIGHRTLRVEDYGKVAATFVDLATAAAIRIVPRRGCESNRV